MRRIEVGEHFCRIVARGQFDQRVGGVDRFRCDGQQRVDVGRVDAAAIDVLRVVDHSGGERRFERGEFRGIAAGRTSVEIGGQIVRWTHAFQSGVLEHVDDLGGIRGEDEAAIALRGQPQRLEAARAVKEVELLCLLVAAGRRVGAVIGLLQARLDDLGDVGFGRGDDDDRRLLGDGRLRRILGEAGNGRGGQRRTCQQDRHKTTQQVLRRSEASAPAQARQCPGVAQIPDSGRIAAPQKRGADRSRTMHQSPRLQALTQAIPHLFVTLRMLPSCNGNPEVTGPVRRRDRKSCRRARSRAVCGKASIDRSAGLVPPATSVRHSGGAQRR